MLVVIEDTLPPDQRSSGANDFEGYDSHDGGTNLSVLVGNDTTPIGVEIRSSRGEPGDDPNHETFHALMGKRVRITIETLD